MSRKRSTPDTRIETEGLSPDDQAVLAEYLSNGMNATRAWMKTHPNSAYNTARARGSEWVSKSNIQAELTRIFKERAMSAEEALARLGDIARGTHYHFIRVDDDGFVWFNFADPEAREYMHLIKKLKTKRERRIDGQGDSAEEWEGEWVEVELYDAQAAQRDILKMHGRFVDHVDVTSQGESIAPKMSDEERLSRMKQLAVAIAEAMQKNAG